MSGGHWDYEQRRLADFGERLLREKDVVLAGAGRLIVEVASALHDADWFLSGDTGEWKTRQKLADLISGSVLAEAATRAEDAARDLREAMRLSTPPQHQDRTAG